VSPGDLTVRGRTLIKLMGSYYRDWLLSNHLYDASGCLDAGRTYIWADTDQRTLETGRAFGESLLPGCSLGIHSKAAHGGDPIFSGVGMIDPERSINAVRERMGADPQKLLADHKPAFDALQSVLSGDRAAAVKLTDPWMVGVSLHGKNADLDGPFNAGSSLAEDFLLEYVDGMAAKDLGWGRLTRENLDRILEIHKVYADLARRTPYIARARSSNLVEHILRSMEQAESAKPVPGALGRAGDRVLVLVGHDTNLSNISGMLGLSWHLKGYQPDDTPPGGALIFALWQDHESGRYSVRTQYVAQTLDQMRNAVALTISDPPEAQEVSIPGCDTVAPASGCSWAVFEKTIQKAIDPAFISIQAEDGEER
jgi:4-phytase/acid phosphatase